MLITNKDIENISNEYGDSFYILDTEQFEKNYNELLTSFRNIYSNTHIAYSYKTNYTPRLCSIINKLGGFAEIVSDMEYEIAKKLNVPNEKIFFNGPYKNPKAVQDLLLSGGIVNIDSLEEFNFVQIIAQKYPNKILNIGIRCNFDINDGVVSRFGFDTTSNEFEILINSISKNYNINLVGLHSHFASRNILTWPQRAKKILELVDKYFETPPQYISLGGGIFGKMKDSLKAQFDVEIPTYSDYANSVAFQFEEHFKNLEIKPKLVIEPGSALVGDSMKFVSKVISIKDVRGKKIATLLGSIYNINPTLNKKNPPITIYHTDKNTNVQNTFKNLDFGGFTCIESDYLYKNYYGELSVGDYALFDNVGSYSIVLKPPFILPNFPIIELDINKNILLIKEKECFNDLFHTFNFDL
ncbi:MAG: pyridoxal-dependent decarboxylase [Pleomorphochaeta sp.]